MPSRTQHWIFKNNKYYYRLQSRAGGIKIDILIPLEIDMSLSTIQQNNQAEKRGLIVHQQRKNLLNGIIDKTYFEWINDDKVSKVRTITLKNAIDDYLLFKKVIKKVKQKTLNGSYKPRLKHLINCFGNNLSIQNIKSNEVIKYNLYCSKTFKTKYGIFNHLDQFKSFIEWIYERKLKEYNLEYTNKPIIDLPKRPKTRISYITDQQWDKLLKLDYNILFPKSKNPNFLKKVFNFYRNYGCRLKEPFVAKLKKMHNQKFLMYVEPEDAKAGGGVENVYREIMLSNEDGLFLKNFQNKIYDKDYKFISIAKPIKLSEKFKKIKDYTLGKEYKLNFHKIRHTFGVREYIKTKDIYEVSKKMGHSDIKVTIDFYTKHNQSKLQTDFPSLKKHFKQ